MSQPNQTYLKPEGAEAAYGDIVRFRNGSQTWKVLRVTDKRDRVWLTTIRGHQRSAGVHELIRMFTHQEIVNQ